AATLTTVLLKEKTNLCLPALFRHSKPGSPSSGKLTSKVPAAPWVLRETALVNCSESTTARPDGPLNPISMNAGSPPPLKVGNKPIVLPSRFATYKFKPSPESAIPRGPDNPVISAASSVAPVAASYVL